MSPYQALQAHKLPNNGYYIEDISPSLIISHYHTTYIPFNITKIELTLSQLLSNLLIITPLVNRQNNNLTYTQFYYVSKALNTTYETYAKLDTTVTDDYKRKKRGLFNFLGNGIKFITGNLDNIDLETITQNLQILKQNQLNSMHKINDLSSFAGNIINKFEENIKIVNENAKNIQSEFFKINNQINLIILLQQQYVQITNLNQFLEKILRILSFAHLKTLDLEIVSLKDIQEIWQYLEMHYPKNALWSINHLSELTLICKTGLLILTEMAILVIKIPIFEKNVCYLKFVYPIPNNESKILINPSKYYCNDLWYNHCQEVNSKWICSGPIANSCTLSKNCQYATVQNNYQVHTLTHRNSLLFCTRTPETIYENCFQFQKATLQDCYIIESQCDVIINQYKYSLIANNITVVTPKIIRVQDTNLTLNLHIRHLENPQKIQEDLMEPVIFQDLAFQHQHHTFILFTMFIIILGILAVVIWLWRRQSQNGTIPLKTLQKLINEDVEETEGGGVITPN